MNVRQWARQWDRLVRQEADLGQGLQHGSKEQAPRFARGPAALAGPTQQLRAHLDRQLAELEALRAQEAAAGEAPALNRRRRQVGAALAQLATACAAQLQELDELEVQLRHDYEEATKGAWQLLAGGNAAAVQQQGSALDGPAQQRARGGADSPAARTAEKCSSLPPEVTAHDTFLQRHGPTGEARRELQPRSANTPRKTQDCCRMHRLLALGPGHSAQLLEPACLPAQTPLLCSQYP